MSGIVTVYAVFADFEEAERIGRAMVEDRLAACVNLLGPSRSIYRWEGAIDTADEVAALFKTRDDLAGRVVARIAAMHSYETPCIVVWPITAALPIYSEWVASAASG